MPTETSTINAVRERQAAGPPAWVAWNLTAITLLGALLLFQVQPMIGKFILPWFGGCPAVWTTCMLFFQTMLFGGYAFAHGLARWTPPRWQPAISSGVGRGRGGHAADRAGRVLEAGRPIAAHAAHPHAVDGHASACPISRFPPPVRSRRSGSAEVVRADRPIACTPFPISARWRRC